MIHQSDRSAWLEARKPYITASDVARLLCQGWAKTEADRENQRKQVIMEKAGLADAFEQNEHTELASLLEVPVIKIAAERWGIDLRPHGYLVPDPTGARLAATPDAYWHSGDRFIPVNVKLTTCQPPELCKPKKNGDPSDAAFANGLPLYHQIQSMSEVACTDASHGGMLVLHHGRSLTLRMYLVARHDVFIARIRKEVERAWVDIEALKNGRLSA